MDEVELIEQILCKMDLSLVVNAKQIRKYLGSLRQVDEYGRSLLHTFVDNKYDEEKCFLAVKSLLFAGVDPNLADNNNYNFIQTALYTGYSEKFIINIINEALKYKLDVNHIDDDRDTMVHTAICSDDYLDEVINIYELLCDNGFDSKRVNEDGQTLIDAIVFQKQYTKEQITKFLEMFIDKIENQENKRGKLLQKNKNRK